MFRIQLTICDARHCDKIRSCGYSDIGVVDQENMATNNVPRIAVLVEFNYEDLEVI